MQAAPAAHINAATADARTIIRRAARVPWRRKTKLFFCSAARREQFVLGKVAQLGLSALVAGQANPARGSDLAEFAGRPVAAGTAESFLDFSGHVLHAPYPYDNRQRAVAENPAQPIKNLPLRCRSVASCRGALPRALPAAARRFAAAADRSAGARRCNRVSTRGARVPPS